MLEQTRDVETEDAPGVNLQRFLEDPNYDPPAVAPPTRAVNELMSQPLFKKQRREHVGDVALAEEFVDEPCICCLLDLPQKASDWKKLKRSPETFYAKKIKGAEVRWHQLDVREKENSTKAKQAEVQQWISAAAAKRAAQDHLRLVRMRWVLTYKESGQPKGRIVLIGYEDPDLEKIQSAVPTMSRR